MDSIRGGASGRSKPPDAPHITTFKSGCRGSGLYTCLPSKRLSSSRHTLCSLPGCDDEDFPSQGWSGSQNQLIFAGPLRSGVGDRLVKNPIYIDTPFTAPLPQNSPSSTRPTSPPQNPSVPKTSPSSRPSPPPSPSSSGDQQEGQSLVFGCEDNDLDSDLDDELQADLDLQNGLGADLQSREEEVKEGDYTTVHCNVKDTQYSAKVTECGIKVKETSKLQGAIEQDVSDIAKDVSQDVLSITKSVARDAYLDESIGGLGGVPSFVTVFDPSMPRSGREARGVTGHGDVPSSRHGPVGNTTTSPSSPPTPPPLPPLTESSRFSPPLQESGSDVPLVPSATSSDTFSDFGDQRRSVSFIPGTADNEGKVGKKVTRHKRQGSGGKGAANKSTTSYTKNTKGTGEHTSSEASPSGSKGKTTPRNHKRQRGHRDRDKETHRSSKSSSDIELRDTSDVLHTSSTSVTSGVSRPKTPRGNRPRRGTDPGHDPDSAGTTSAETETRLQIEDDSQGNSTMSTAKHQKNGSARTMEESQKDNGVSPKGKNTAKDRAERAKRQRHRSGEKKKMSNADYDQMIKSVVKRTKKNRLCNVAIIMGVALVILGIAAYVTVHFTLKVMDKDKSKANAVGPTTPSPI